LEHSGTRAEGQLALWALNWLIPVGQVVEKDFAMQTDLIVVEVLEGAPYMPSKGAVSSCSEGRSMPAMRATEMPEKWALLRRLVHREKMIVGTMCEVIRSVSN
jgi:hypothetical protein